MFKVGDRVRCIDCEPEYGHKLSPNSSYTITYISKPYLKLDNDNTKTYEINRFELAYIQEFNDKLEDLIDNESCIKYE
jgi:hypothetical protein